MAHNKIVTMTRSESLLIWRRRKEWTQFQAAKELKMPVDRYRDFENDRKNVKDNWQEIPTNQELAIGELKPFEVCLLLRKRAGLLQREVAAAIGVTRLWVIRMEEGKENASRLRDYWEV